MQGKKKELRVALFLWQGYDIRELKKFKANIKRRRKYSNLHKAEKQRCQEDNWKDQEDNLGEVKITSLYKSCNKIAAKSDGKADGRTPSSRHHFFSEETV